MALVPSRKESPLTHRGVVLISEGTYSRFVVAPVDYQAFLLYLERLYQVPFTRLQLFQLAGKNTNKISDRSTMQKLMSEEGPITIYVKTAGLDSVLHSQVDSDYIIGFEEPMRLRLQSLEDNSLTHLSSEVLDWTGRVCLYPGNSIVFTGGSEIPRAAYLFSISENGLYTKLGDLNHGRQWHGLCTYEHLVYVAGGRDPDTGNILRSAEQLTNNVWTDLPDMNFPRESLALIANKTAVYAVGGFEGSKRLQSIECFKTGKWMMVPIRLPEPRQMPGLVFTEENTLLVIGGQDEYKERKSVYELHLNTGQVIELPSLPVADYFTGRQLVKKASGDIWGFGKQTYVYFPKLQMWATATRQVRSRNESSA